MPPKESSTSIIEWDKLTITIAHHLVQCGISPRLGGYDYLVTAIAQVLKSPDCIHYITKEIYPSVARQHDATVSQVEKSIRTAVLHGWKATKCEALSKMTGYHLTERPTNSEFIALSAEHIRYKAMDPRED